MMQLLQWTDRYATGIAEIDQEHRGLIEFVNRLHDGWFADDAGLTAGRFFTRLLDEISAHFASEEVAMRDGAYDQFADHKEEHDRFIDEIRDIMEASGQSDEIDSLELAYHLDSWFAHHFTTYDAQNASALQSDR
jgi:hemerythrin